MKKILAAIVSVLLVLLMLEKVWDFLVLENQNIKLSFVGQESVHPTVLFHGPCEPLFTISPTYMDSITGVKSYNYALRHTDFADNYLHLHLYLKNNSAPEKMYLYVTPESYDLRFNTFHTFRFAAYLKDSVVAKVVKEMDPNYYKYTWVPFLKYVYYNNYKTFDAIQGFKHWVSNSKSPYFADGHVPHENTDYSRNEDGFIAPKNLLYANGNEVEQLNDSSTFYEIYDSAQVFQWDLTREKYLRKIIDLAQVNKIDLTLYESTPYWGSIIDQPNRNEFISKIKTLATEYDVRYLVYDTLAIGKVKSNFVCPLILGEEAGKVFMNKLAKEI